MKRPETLLQFGHRVQTLLSELQQQGDVSSLAELERIVDTNLQRMVGRENTYPNALTVLRFAAEFPAMISPEEKAWATARRAEYEAHWRRG